MRLLQLLQKFPEIKQKMIKDAERNDTSMKKAMVGTSMLS